MFYLRDVVVVLLRGGSKSAMLVLRLFPGPRDRLPNGFKWNPVCIVIDFSSVQFKYLGFLGFPFDRRRERTVEFALIQSRANDPGFNS